MENSKPQMTILNHIKELRTRLLVSVVALFITTTASFAFSQYLAEFLAKPIGGLQAMSSIDVTENVTAFMKISLLAGVILALPIIVSQVLAFIVPGLNPNERPWIWIMIPLATLFFFGGVAFAYFFMLPTALPFLMNFMGITTSPRPSTYFGFVTNLMFWVGVSFELPLVMYVLARLHIVSAKQLLKQWRIAILASAILAAFITPTVDPVNMGLMTLPLFALYLLSIIFAVIARRERKEKVKKRLSKRKWILLLVTFAIILAAISTAVLVWPEEVDLVLSSTSQFFVKLWESISRLLTKT